MLKRGTVALIAVVFMLGACARTAEKTEEEEGAAGGRQQGGTAERQGGRREGAGGGTQRQPERQTVDAVVPAGTTFSIALDQALSSETNNPGDPVRAHLVGELKSGDGQTVATPGAQVRGTVAQVEGSDRVKGRAFLAINFTSIETVGGSRDVQTTMVEGPLEAKGTKKRDAAIIVGGTAAGAVLGEILGDSPKLGAIIGAAAGTGVVLATKGEELEVGPGTELHLKLVSPITVPVRKTSSPT